MTVPLSALPMVIEKVMVSKGIEGDRASAGPGRRFFAFERVWRDSGLLLCVCVCVCVCYDVNVAFISVKSAASEDSCGIPNITVFVTAHAGMVKVR